MTVGNQRGLYFGCWGDSGHRLYAPSGKRILNPLEEYPGFPWEFSQVDTGLLKNGKHRDNPDGRVWWTCRAEPVLWYAFFWWDRSIDARDHSNSGFYVRGFEMHQPARAFEYACQIFPLVVARQKFPLVLQCVPAND